MNILLISDYFPPNKIGGVGQIVQELKISYEKLGHNVYVLTTGKSKDIKVYTASNNLIIGIILNNIYAIRLIKKYKIDLIHSHQGSTTLFYIFKYIYKKFPKIIHSFQVSYFSEYKNIKKYKINNKLYKPTNYEYIEKYFFAPIHIVFDTIGYYFSDYVTAPSSQNLQELNKILFFKKKSSRKIVPNGLRIDEKNIKLSLPNSKPIKFLYLGVLRSRKGIFHLLHTFNEINKNYSLDFNLEIVGGGRKYEQIVKTTINELNLNEKVKYLGPASHQVSINKINESHVLCLFTFYEGMPLVLLEAISKGKPVITSNIYGMKDLYSNVNFGLTIDPRNIKETAEKVIYFIDNFGNQKINIEQYNWDYIAESYLELIS